MTERTPAPPRKSLVAIVGVIAAIGLGTSIPRDESGRTVEARVAPDGQLQVEHKAGSQHLAAYRDMVGVLTICDGDTADVKPGLFETPEGCSRRLERQLVEHAEPVMACIPTLREAGRDYQRWAVISLAYNVGTDAVCRSSLARLMRAREWRSGCDQLLRWDRAGGKAVRGLTLRRQREREICLRGL
ncbi:lysozyme [Sphingomonas sp. CBMAI 2297]|uniref:lysozyme n=1 Tax=Sphingomonas sp. CBMAI 2297 TaxID=2991720 RepID=UPI0024581AAE|nr:lysozyme [Sphingomonas sp. CBMAI 2297]MDH4743160.1 lysozyme [Sphingomonas sp. CBMAI 2297]